jgi:hypothetical protein
MRFPPFFAAIASLLVAGCAGQIEDLTVYDRASGYQKSLKFTSSLDRDGQLKTEELVYNGKAEKRDLSNFKVRQFQSIFLLPGSYRLGHDRIAQYIYTVTYKPLGILPAKSMTFSGSLTTLPPPKLILGETPVCIHVHDRVNVRFRLSPPPVKDKVAISPSWRGKASCLRPLATMTKATSGALQFEATCVDEGEIALRVVGRALIPSTPSQRIKIAPALAKPTGIRWRFGDYVVPEEGETEGEGATNPSAPTEKSRRVTFEWDASPESRSEVLEIYRQGINIPSQEAAMDAGNHTFDTVLTAGQQYYVKMRSEYAYCSASEFSADATSEVFVVPN